MSAYDLGTAFVPQAPLAALFLSFLVYSFVGWAWESTACGLMNRGRFVNSGFLLGPVCPIYGVGALVCWLLLRGIDAVLAQFLAAGVVCCGIEYVVGLMLEHITGARFWNYEDQPFNIKGRVCLYGFLLFGAGATLVCKVTQPALNLVLGHVPAAVLALVAAACAVLLAVDLVFAMASWRRLSSRLEQLRCEISLRLNNQLGEVSERMIERLPPEAVERVGEAYERTRDASAGALNRLAERMPSKLELPELPEWLSAATDAAVSQLGRRDLRFFEAFPQIRFTRYDDAIDRAHLRDRVRDLFGGK
ncbi:putative ABC transporter permease [Olsenella uli]|uniref:putative ABC transporter permease n=1 Tax=Olsenella uli TaxID=133926 RepID=UPI0012AB4299|nr:putative ABC transporter permease [Olsenella uli]